MATKTSTPRTMTPSWDLFKPNLILIREHYVGVIYLFLLPSLLSVLATTMVGKPEAINGTLHLTTQQIEGVILLGISLLWQVINIGPLTYFQLRAADGKADTTIGNYYRAGLRFTWRLVLYYIVFGALATVGLLLFIVPGLIVIRRYVLAPYYLVSQDLTTRQALTKSAERSKPYSKAIWGVIGVQVALMFATVLVQGAFSYAGIIIGELLACSYIFLFALRYREIEPA